MQAQTLKVKEKFAFASKLEAIQQNRDVSHSFRKTLDSMENLEKAPEFGKYDNREILHNLEKEKARLSIEVTLLGSIGLSLLATPALTASLIPAAFSIFSCGTIRLKLSRIQKLAQIIGVMEEILDAYEHEGVEVFPFIEIEERQPIDLFVRFPQKVFLIISVTTRNRVSIKFNEARKMLFVRRPNKKGLSKWGKDDPLQELSISHAWLRKNRRDLFGGSSRDARKPLVRVLVLTGETKVDKHEEHLFYSGDARFIRVSTPNSGVMLEKVNLVDFIDLFLMNF